MPKRPFFSISYLLFSIIYLLSGCLSNSPEELDRLTKEDAAFKQMIIARDQAHAQIQAIKADLLEKKKATDMQVEKLRQNYDAFSKAQSQTIDKYRATVDANRNLLKHEIEVSEAQMVAKLKELEGYQSTLSDVQRMLGQSKDIKLSNTEKEKWQERVLMLSEKIRPLSEEIQELKLQARLKKQKLTYLR